jgi:hypothetical protein
MLRKQEFDEEQPTSDHSPPCFLKDGLRPPSRRHIRFTLAMTRESTTLSIAFAVAGEARWTALPSAYTREGIPPP